MRLGGAIERPYQNPEEWLGYVKELGYSTVLCPVDYRADSQTRSEYLKCAKANDLVIGEVGVWRNVLHTDDAERARNMEIAKAQLALAEDMEARCCVNISGSRGEIWDGFHPDNYTPDTYALVVDTVREIIDAVKPVKTCYSIESMPWMVPDSPERYLQLIQDVDRKAFGVHLDFVNMINSPKRYVFRHEFIKHCFDLLGEHIVSIHGKDVRMDQAYTTLIHEEFPGQGTLDYTQILPWVEQLGADIPFFIEHLPDFETYKKCALYIREQSVKCGVTIK